MQARALITTPVIYAGSMTELLAEIYRRNEWTRVAGESRIRRAKRHYHLSIDYKRNMFSATPKMDEQS